MPALAEVRGSNPLSTTRKSKPNVAAKSDDEAQAVTESVSTMPEGRVNNAQLVDAARVCGPTALTDPSPTFSACKTKSSPASRANCTARIMKMKTMASAQTRVAVAVRAGARILVVPDLCCAADLERRWQGARSGLAPATDALGGDCAVRRCRSRLLHCGPGISFPWMAAPDKRRRLSGALRSLDRMLWPRAHPSSVFRRFMRRRSAFLRKAEASKRRKQWRSLVFSSSLPRDR